MKRLCVSVLGLASQIPIRITVLGIHYFTAPCHGKKIDLLERFHIVTQL